MANYFYRIVFDENCTQADYKENYSNAIVDTLTIKALDDLNGDGKRDYIVIDMWNDVYLLLSNGRGRFKISDVPVRPIYGGVKWVKTKKGEKFLVIEDYYLLKFNGKFFVPVGVCYP